MRNADEDRATISEEVVNAVWDGDPDRIGGKIVIVDQNGTTIPFRSRVLEVAHEFPLFGVDADDRQGMTLILRAQGRDIVELSIAVWAGVGGERLAINAQRVVHVVKEARDRVGRDGDRSLLQKTGDLAGCSTTPLQTGNWIACSVVCQEMLDERDYFGRFFSTDFRPAPARRTRPNSTSWSNSSCRPRATV